MSTDSNLKLSVTNVYGRKPQIIVFIVVDVTSDAMLAIYCWINEADTVSVATRG